MFRGLGFRGLGFRAGLSSRYPNQKNEGDQAQHLNLEHQESLGWFRFGISLLTQGCLISPPR